MSLAYEMPLKFTLICYQIRVVLQKKIRKIFVRLWPGEKFKSIATNQMAILKTILSKMAIIKIPLSPHFEID